jgi:hypothetical protein
LARIAAWSRTLTRSWGPRRLEQLLLAGLGEQVADRGELGQHAELGGAHVARQPAGGVQDALLLAGVGGAQAVLVDGVAVVVPRVVDQDLEGAVGRVEVLVRHLAHVAELDLAAAPGVAPQELPLALVPVVLEAASVSSLSTVLRAAQNTLKRCALPGCRPSSGRG